MQRTHQKRDGSVQVHPLRTNQSEAGGAEAIARMMSLEEVPTAAFFANDIMAIGALNACRATGIKVPIDLSILCCGAPSGSVHTVPALSTVNFPTNYLGRRAARKMLYLLDGSSIESCRYKQSDEASIKLISRHSVQNRLNYPTKPNGAGEQINERERDSLQWAARGKTSWEISQILGISESTVIYHMRNATRKLNAANRLHAVTKALKSSLIDF